MRWVFPSQLSTVCKNSSSPAPYRKEREGGYSWNCLLKAPFSLSLPRCSHHLLLLFLFLSVSCLSQRGNFFSRVKSCGGANQKRRYQRWEEESSITLSFVSSLSQLKGETWLSLECRWGFSSFEGFQMMFIPEIVSRDTPLHARLCEVRPPPFNQESMIWEIPFVWSDRERGGENPCS